MAKQNIVKELTVFVIGFFFCVFFIISSVKSSDSHHATLGIVFVILAVLAFLGGIFRSLKNSPHLLTSSIIGVVGVMMFILPLNYLKTDYIPFLPIESLEIKNVFNKNLMFFSIFLGAIAFLVSFIKIQHSLVTLLHDDAYKFVGIIFISFGIGVFIYTASSFLPLLIQGTPNIAEALFEAFCVKGFLTIIWPLAGGYYLLRGSQPIPPLLLPSVDAPKCSNCNGHGVLLNDQRLRATSYDEAIFQCPNCLGYKYLWPDGRIFEGEFFSDDDGYPCIDCGATGFVEVEETRSRYVTSEQICSKCNGKGTLEPAIFDPGLYDGVYGSHIIKAIDRKSYSRQPCDVCHGNKTVTVKQEVKYRVKKKKKCQICKGTGEITKKVCHPCPMCHGKGEITKKDVKAMTDSQECPECQGYGSLGTHVDRKIEIKMITSSRRIGVFLSLVYCIGWTLFFLIKNVVV